MPLRRLSNVRVWLQADLQSPEIEVCSSPNSGLSESYAGLPVLTRRSHAGDEDYGHQAYQ